MRIFRSKLGREIDGLSVVARQCVAAVCFERYCERHGLRHPDIDAFVEHLWRVCEISPDQFTEWERGFGKLRAANWAAPVPGDVLAAVPPQLRDEYSALTEYVIETSAATWYGADMEGSKKYLLKVCEVVGRHGIAPPRLEVFMSSSRQAKGGWGDNPSPEERRRWRYESWGGPAGARG